MSYHVPVLLKEAINALNVKSDGTYADLTFGGGGHSVELLSHLKNGKLMVFDQDNEAFKNLGDNKNVIPVHANFRYIRQFMRYHNIKGFDGIIADLGVSSWQIDQEKRGFSFRFDAELDMRMNPDAPLKAKDIINGYSKEQLIRVFKEYGELKNAGVIVRKIIDARNTGNINTTGDLKELLSPMFRKGTENKFLARVFQALRIEVNQEIESLKDFLKVSPLILKQGGRLVTLSYHSLEDRLVKNMMRFGNIEGEVKKDFYGNVITPFKQITRKPIQADDEEIKRNQRARSVKMRIAELKTHE
ncbi:MAG: 16S rRNA (cytosine(1402)-N(4))-methyltransferase RsmH [Bacteroidota bacterium]